MKTINTRAAIVLGGSMKFQIKSMISLMVMGAFILTQLVCFPLYAQDGGAPPQVSQQNQDPSATVAVSGSGQVVSAREVELRQQEEANANKPAFTEKQEAETTSDFFTEKDQLTVDVGGVAERKLEEKKELESGTTDVLIDDSSEKKDEQQNEEKKDEQPLIIKQEKPDPKKEAELEQKKKAAESAEISVKPNGAGLLGDQVTIVFTDPTGKKTSYQKGKKGYKKEGAEANQGKGGVEGLTKKEFEDKLAETLGLLGVPKDKLKEAVDALVKEAGKSKGDKSVKDLLKKLGLIP